MKKTQKKNNKGFSLVELIVVVLIMAIIAVALAPQIMKWVGNSRIASDRQTADSVVSAGQTALTDKSASALVKTGYSNSIVISNTGIAATTVDAWTNEVSEVLGIAALTTTAVDTVKTKTSGAVITVSINASGKVTWAETSSPAVLTSADLD